MRTDILLDDDGDLLDDGNGDFATGESSQDEVNSLVISHKGNWKEFPFAGLGISKFLKKRAGASVAVDSLPTLMRSLKLELDNDGHKNPVVNISADLSEFSIEVVPTRTG